MIGLTLLYGAFLVLAITLVGLVKATAEPNQKQNCLPTTFIVPFKNEVERLRPLINSLNQSKWFDQFEVIFVDDHSSDTSCEFILNELDIPFTIIRSLNTPGKKQAIAEGVYHAQHEHIHTLDADVSFGEDYLESIAKLPLSDLTILPVELTGTSLFEQLNSIEFQWLQTFTFALARLKQATLCNGANLSFSKTAFLATLPQRTDFNLASGDDVYLLSAILKNKGVIAANANPHLAVQTPAPATFKTLISQRQRWIKKVLNLPTIIVILLYALYHTLPLLFLFNIDYHLLWAAPLALKILAEWVLSRNHTIKQFGLMVLHQGWYLVYGVLLLRSLGRTVRWK
ncbi:MAG: glycosyltransferase [Putridiphycobacter sp.]|nr:glycosyltransferase [Putridiphycobacter sp.]